MPNYQRIIWWSHRARESLINIQLQLLFGLVFTGCLVEENTSPGLSLELMVASAAAGQNHYKLFSIQINMDNIFDIVELDSLISLICRSSNSQTNLTLLSILSAKFINSRELSWKSHITKNSLLLQKSARLHLLVYY